ncbi:MAG: L-lactate permease [Chloroflexota bacterium]
MIDTLPVDAFRIVLALLPIVTLIVLLLGLNWSAPEAGAMGVFVALAAALIGYRTSLETITVASAKGVWDAVFILYVVWPALWLYHISARAGAFDALRQGIMRFSRNELFLVLVFGWVFVSFLQGITGFGTPIAMVVPLLVALGVRPLFAVAAPLIGHAWGNMLGTLALAWLATLQVISLDEATTAQTAFQISLLLILPNLFAGLAVAWMHSRWRGVRLALPMILVISAAHGGVQTVLAANNTVLSNFTAVTVGFALLVPLSRWARYREPLPYEDNHMMQSHNVDAVEDTPPSMGLFSALLPYIVLMVTALVVLIPEPVNTLLGRWTVGLPFPEVSTGFDLVREAANPYAPFAPLTHPGSFLLLAGIVTYAVYRGRGWIQRGAEQPPIGTDLVRDAVPSSLAIVFFLVLSKMMDHSGQTLVLAQGIAVIVPANVYPSIAPTLGVLGAFMTSSNTASNVLFAPVQETIATLAGLPVSTIIAAQGAGAAVGNAIAPANIVLGTGPAGILGQEGRVMREALPYAVIGTVFVGMGAWLLVALAGGG